VPEVIIAVEEGDFHIELEALKQAVAAQWPNAKFVPPLAGTADLTQGLFEIPEPGAARTVQLDINPTGQCLGIESAITTEAAKVIAWLTTLPGFGENSSVILAQWVPDFVRLTPGMTAEQLTSLFD